jgi:hypothetical protein
MTFAPHWPSGVEAKAANGIALSLTAIAAAAFGILFFFMFFFMPETRDLRFPNSTQGAPTL